MLTLCLSHFITTVLEIYNFPHYFPTNYVWYRSCSILWQKRLFSLEFLSNIQGQELSLVVVVVSNVQYRRYPPAAPGASGLAQAQCARARRAIHAAPRTRLQATYHYCRLRAGCWLAGLFGEKRTKIFKTKKEEKALGKAKKGQKKADKEQPSLKCIFFFSFQCVKFNSNTFQVF